MPREDVLHIFIAKVNLVSLFDGDLTFGGFGGRVDFSEENPSRGTGLGCSVFERGGLN
jgi:hypothetical protein